MRYPASEKLEIIRLVERSHLPAKQTLDMLSVPRTTFYRWYERYRLEGRDALQDKAPLPARVWNRIPDAVRDRLLALALDRPELSPREFAKSSAVIKFLGTTVWALTFGWILAIVHLFAGVMNLGVCILIFTAPVALPNALAF